MILDDFGKWLLARIWSFSDRFEWVLSLPDSQSPHNTLYQADVFGVEAEHTVPSNNCRASTEIWDLRATDDTIGQGVSQNVLHERGANTPCPCSNSLGSALNRVLSGLLRLFKGMTKQGKTFPRQGIFDGSLTLTLVHAGTLHSG
jgi:hypothetical protein